jgi:2,4-dienoyl-CoA reductase-like NADH-dependent reductase (Old Yellow Enzyme family)
MVKHFANVALRAKMPGFDMVEVHGTRGYLIAKFLSPLTNKRTNKYGTDRTLFAMEIVRRIKEK